MALNCEVIAFYQWRQKFGGLDVSEARKLKILEEENRKLKQIVADQTLETRALKEALTKKW